MHKSYFCALCVRSHVDHFDEVQELECADNIIVAKALKLDADIDSQIKYL